MSNASRYVPGTSVKLSVNVARRPFSSVTPRPTGVHSLCCRISRITVMPLAGAPSPRSRMCVVIIFFGAAGPHPRRLPPRASRRSALVSSPLLLGARPTSFLSALGAGQQPFAAWGASHLAPLGARRWSASLCCLGARPTSRLSALGAGQQPFAAWGLVPPRASRRSALVSSPSLLGGASHLAPLSARRWSGALCCLGRIQ